VENIAVFSDIYGNHVALQAAFDYCVGKGITSFICLGNYVGDLPNPDKTMNLIHAIDEYFDAKFLMGNREELLLEYRRRGESGWVRGSAAGAYLYTYNNLSPRDLSFFEGMSIAATYEKPGLEKFDYCHGSPNASNEILVRDKRNTKKTLSLLKTGYLIHGYYPIQEAYNYNGKRSIGPGSIGMPWQYEGKTQFCILHCTSSGWEEENIQLDYDKGIILKEFETSGMMEMAPAHCAVTMHTIKTGIDLSEVVLLTAMRHCEKETGTCIWPNIDEKYFAKALREVGLDLSGNRI